MGRWLARFCVVAQVVGGSSNKQLANEIAKEMGLKCGAVTLGRYADGEVMVQLDEHVRGKGAAAAAAAVATFLCKPERCCPC